MTIMSKRNSVLSLNRITLITIMMMWTYISRSDDDEEKVKVYYTCLIVLTAYVNMGEKGKK